jgi:hypothetical protein
MVEGIHGIQGPQGPDRVSRKRKKDQPSQAQPSDSVEISEGARMAGSPGRFVQFVKASPETRVEHVKAARADLEQGILFSDEVINLAAERFVEDKTRMKKG